MTELLDKHGLAERWGVEADRILRLRRRDEPPPAEQTRPKLLFDPEVADEWAREHGPEGLDVPPPDGDDLMDKSGLAERWGVSENTVRYYRHKQDMPIAGRGDHNRCLYDPEECEQYLVDQGIWDEAPSAQGGSRDKRGPKATTGQAARGAQGTAGSRDGPGEEATADQDAEPAEPAGDEADDAEPDAETGMEEMVRRERQLERRLYEQTKQDPSPANLKAYKKVAQERRLAEKALREEKEARGELIPRSQYEKDLCALGSLFRRRFDQFAHAAPKSLLEALSQEGVVENPKEALGTVQALIEGKVDEWLEDVSRQIKEMSQE